jgi:hypothetical protein
MHLRRWRLTESYKWLADKHPRMQLSPGGCPDTSAVAAAMLGIARLGGQAHRLTTDDKAAGDQTRLIDYEVKTLGSSSVSFGGLQMQQALQATSSVQQQAGSLFSWNSSSHVAAAQQPPHTGNSGGLLQMPEPELAFGATQAAAPSGGFSFSPGASAGSFVFGASPQQSSFTAVHGEH